MDHPTRRRRWRSGPLVLEAVLLVALLATIALAPDHARTTIQATARTLAGWLRQSLWVWPLAAALTLAALTSPPARRWWRRPTRRIPPAIGIFVLLITLISLATGSRPRGGVLAVGVAVVVGLLAAWVLVVPRRLAPPVPAEVLDRFSDRDRLEVVAARLRLQNDLRATPLQAIAGLAVLAGALLGFQQLTEDRQQATAARTLALQGQASERFTRAIDQLGSDREDSRVGGIYGLEQIAQQAPDNRLAVAEVLVAYLHRRVPRPAKPPPVKIPGEDTGEVLRTRVQDAQAALTVLGRRQTADTDPPLDLRALDLIGANLEGAELRRANLEGTDLRAADLPFANLEGADLPGADLAGANLHGANLGSADLQEADLHFAELGDATLSGGNLVGANLSDASLIAVDLSGMPLGLADFRRADLRGARLSGSDLRGAKFQGATADPSTTWPDGFDWEGAGVRLESSTGP